MSDRTSADKPQCTICLDKSSGFHYGTHTCEACKCFFRRMVTNSILIQVVLQCTGSDKYKCEISPNTRNNCQRCRLQKCFQMGMTRYKTRLGRRTKAFSLKLERSTPRSRVCLFVNDEEMVKLIRRENKFFSNNDAEDIIQPLDEEIPQAKCVKYKAKLYSERNSSIHQMATFSSIGSNQSEKNLELGSEGHQLVNNTQMTSIHHTNNINRNNCFFDTVKANSENPQIEQICIKIRSFFNLDSNSEDFQHFIYYKTTISALTDFFNHPNLEEMEEYYRTRIEQVTYIYNPLLVFLEMIKELSNMSRKIFAFFKRLPDFELFGLVSLESKYIKKTIVQTLYVWLIRFVNVSENVIYNTKLTMKIPRSVLWQTPLNRFFETLFQYTDICNSTLTMEIDDYEISHISALIITFPEQDLNNSSKFMLQSDDILKVRFLYCASLYDHIFTQRCNRKHDLTEHRLQKLCWLINESDLLNENEVNYLFSQFDL